MVSVAEAEKIILGHPFLPKIESVALELGNGRILAEEIKADRDLPPFDRATMDGICIAYRAYQNRQHKFDVVGEQAAGQTQKTLNDPTQSLEIMTGASLPIGTDTVVPYEAIELNNNIAAIKEVVSKNQNVHRQGADAKKGEVLLHPGQKLSAAEIALLASVGKSYVSVYKNPMTAIISTGDELVAIEQTPLPHQVRKSNSYALMAALQEMNVQADSFHLNDDPVEIEEKLKLILENYELIILTGGVSKGKHDYVPAVLESLRVEKLFHGISQRPGKPLWFGVSPKNFVFALPGNPVSTLLCFHRYVKPWLMKSFHQTLNSQFAVLIEDFHFEPQLTYFLQVKIKNENGTLMAHPHKGGGSGDFANLKDVDGFLELPLGRKRFSIGDYFTLFLLK